jgi:2-octaprenyl-6-methoxyphenol hydroxylase
LPRAVLRWSATTAHRLPPIGAQGLNHRIARRRDHRRISGGGDRAKQDIGGPDVLSRYDAQRRADVTARTLAIDLLNRSPLVRFSSGARLRGLGLYLLNRILVPCAAA